MKEYLSEEQFKDVQSHVTTGAASITVPRGISRQFFMRVTNDSIKSTTGKSALAQKSAIWAFEIISLLCLAICCVALIDAFSWWATMAVPLTGIFWAVLAGLTNENGDWRTITAALFGALLSGLFMPESFSSPLMLFVFSLWIHRMSFLLSQNFLIKLVTGSYAAYDMLAEHVEISHPGSQAQQTREMTSQ